MKLLYLLTFTFLFHNFGLLAEVKSITPNAQVKINQNAEPFFAIDFIYFDTTQAGLDYAYTKGSGPIYYPEFQFEPGFKLALGVNLLHDGWDFISNYTYLHTCKNYTNDLFPLNKTIINSIHSTVPIFDAQTTWNLKLDTIDFELGKGYYISSNLVLRPFLGAKAAWNRQMLNLTTHVSQLEEYDLFQTNQYQTAFGFGIRSGINTKYQFCKSWNIYTSSAFNLLSSDIQNDYRLYSQFEPALVFANDKIKSRLNTLQPVIELGMGLAYEYYFFDDQYRVLLSLGYEFQYWNNNNFFGQSKLKSTIVEEPTFDKFGDLSIQGLDLKVRFDF